MKQPLSRVGVGGLVLLLLLILAALFGLDLDSLIVGGVAEDGESVAPRQSAGPWYEVYFTDPSCPSEDERSGGLDEIIAADLSRASRQVDVAAFDLDAEPIVQALIELEGRGVMVRVVTDTDNAGLSSINRLRRNGISVVEDNRSALMHNKFIVIDGRYLWVGSMNLTSNGVYCNNNNFVRIDSPQLATNYATEMDEMVVDRLFGPRSPDNTPRPALTIQGVEVASFFASEADVAPRIAQLLAGAQREILFLAFVLTNETIGEAIIDRAETGISVRGVFETTGSDTAFSYFPEMRAAGLSNLQVRQDGNPRLMHHKVIIIDGRSVVFGSYNFSGSANDDNDENLLVVHDPEFAGYFVEEFEAVWSEARP